MTINMTETSASEYQATIPGQEYCTWVTYKVVGYDNAGNTAIKDNFGNHYKYHVISEYPLDTLTIMILTILTITTWKTKRKHQSTHFSVSHHQQKRV